MVWEDINRLGPVSVLDIGAGEGKWGRLLKAHCPKATADAVEVWPANVERIQRGLYRDIFSADVRRLPFGKYDAVILGDVLEHMPQGDALALVERLKERCSRIYLTIPVTVCEQDGELLGNPYETHVYHWSDKEIRALGFQLLHVGANERGLVAVGTYRWTG